MKRLLTLFLTILCFGATAASAQFSADASVRNIQVDCNTVSFDIFLKNTGSQTLYLGSSSFWLDFASSKFSNPPSCSFTLSDAFNGFPLYSGACNFGGNTQQNAIFAPFPQTTTNSIVVSTLGDGTKIATVTIEDVIDFTGTLDLVWDSFSAVLAWDPGTNTEVPATVNFETPAVAYCGPVFEAAIRNQELLNDIYTFDLHLKRTDGQDFFLDETDIVLTFDNTAFTNPVYSVKSVGNATLNSHYSFAPQPIVGDRLELAISGPSPANVTTQGDFDSKVQKISSSDNGTLVVTMQVTGANGGTSVFQVNPLWVTAGLPRTLFHNRRNCAPFNFSDDVTDNASYVVEAPTFFVDLLAPNGGEEFCPGATETITWNSSNVLNVKIDLLDNGVTTSTISASTPASDGTFDWDIPIGLTPGADYTIRVSDLSDLTRFDDSDANFEVNELAVITDQPVSSVVCEDDDAAFSVVVDGTNLLYQWFKNGSPLSGETDALLSFNGAAVADAGSYYVEITGPCELLTSNTVTLTVNTPPVIVQQPTATTATVGDAVSLSVVATGTALTFQWQKFVTTNVYTDVPGATQATLSFPNVQATDAGDYRVLVSGACPPTAASVTVTLTVLNLFTYVDVKVYMQGYWDATNQVHAETPVAVELRDASQSLPVSAFVDRITGMLSTTGTITAVFENLDAGQYYVVVRHGGHIPVGSSTPLVLNPGDMSSYDFTDAANKTFGVDATIQDVADFVVRAGDLNGDRNILVNDVLPLAVPNLGQFNPGQVPAP